jgi:hypothetical protein
VSGQGVFRQVGLKEILEHEFSETLVVGQLDKGFIADAMNVCLKARNSQANR